MGQSKGSPVRKLSCEYHYLGVGMQRESLDEQVLRSKYLKLVKSYHPDRHPDASPEERNELEVKFQELQVYYEELLKLLS